MRLFDTHCHFDFAPFADDIAAHLAQAHSVGVERIMLPSIGAENWQLVRDLASRHCSIYYALGFHPYFLTPDASIKQLEKQLSERDNKCVAVGECGLDAMINIDPQWQEQLFIAQVRLAQQSQLPLVIHCRKSQPRLLQLLKQLRFEQGGVVHGFSGSYQQAMQWVERGFFIGVGGVITYPRAQKTRHAIASLPLQHIVLETDSPDMPLNGHQGKPNHPKMIAQILTCLSELKEMPKQTVAENVWKNSNLAFGICE